MKIIRPMDVNDVALISSDVPETDHAEYNAGTTYGLGARAIDSSLGVHLIYESLQAGNIGHALTDTAWWLEVGATNPWRMFDESVSSQTEQADQVEVVIQADGRVDSVTLLNLEAAQVQVVVTDATDGEIYNETKVTTATSGITDWYAYFYEPIVRTHNLFFGDILPYSGATFTITITDPESTVEIGECILGLSKDIGDTQYGAQVGIQDYSVKTQDDFGNYTILQRAFAKRGVFKVWLDKGLVDMLVELLTSLRATPALYIGSDSYGSTIIYGFYKDFSIDISYYSYSVCSIEIEGLT